MPQERRFHFCRARPLNRSWTGWSIAQRVTTFRYAPDESVDGMPGGDLNKAERMSAITIREEPNNPTCLDTYGWIMHLQGQDELARFYLNKALQNASTDENKNEIIKHLEALRADKPLKR